MQLAPTVLIKVKMSFAGLEKTHGVVLLLLKRYSIHLLPTIYLPFRSLSLLVSWWNLTFLNSREPSQFEHSHESKK